MKILVCPDSFKESLSAGTVAEAVSQGIQSAIPDALVTSLALADGGEGTCEVLVKNTGGQIVYKRVHDPIMCEINSFYGIIGDGETAVIEMSAASGIELLKDNEKNPMVTSTFGTGELIKDAIERGCRNLIIGLGGSATNDAGAGMALALGFQLLDPYGNSISSGGEGLGKLSSIRADKDLLQLLETIKITAACDVTNPLSGINGASYVYGPQKGASKEQVEILDKNLENFAAIVERDLGKKVRELPGSGAAGGLGAGLMAFANAELKSGFTIIADLLKLEEKIREADLIITAEGRVDAQTLRGKVPVGVARLAAKYHKPVLVFTGSTGEGAEEIYKEGVSVIIPIIDAPMSLEEAKKKTEELLRKTTERTLRLISLNKNFNLFS